MGTKQQGGLWIRQMAYVITTYLFSLIVLSILSPASEVCAEGNTADRPIGANEDTYNYVSEAIGFYGDIEWIQQNCRRLNDEEALQKLQAGELDMVSVFLDEKTKMRLLAKAKQKPTEYIVGHRAVYAIVPAHRKLKQLTFSQLGAILSGKITKWEQLQAGRGDIYIETDKVALGILATKTKIPLPETFDVKRWHIEDEPWSSPIHKAADGESVHEMLKTLSTPPEEYMYRADNILILTARGDPLGEYGKQYEKRIRFVPVARESDAVAIPPTLEEIRKQNYPLMQTWRLIVRKGASKRIVGYAKLCQRGYDGTLCNLHYVKDWLIQPALSAANTIRIPKGKWYFIMPDLITAYSRGRESVKILQVDHDVTDWLRVFLRGDCDLLDLAGPLWPEQKKELETTLGPKVQKRIIGYRPLLVLVHPDNPVSSLSFEQIRRVATHDITPWSLLGWKECDRNVVKRFWDYTDVKHSLFPDEVMMKHVEGQLPGPRPKRITREFLMREANYCAQFTKSQFINTADMLREASEDRYGIALVRACEEAWNSGLKVLAVVGADGEVYPPTPINVTGGRYPARTEMSILIHPQAGRAVGEFVDWLESPGAGKILAKHSVYSPAGARTVKPEIAALATASTTCTQPFDGNVTGAAAVLPTQMMNLYYLMAREEHLHEYDRCLWETLERDGRLTLVDRDEIRRILQERKLQLQSSRDRPPDPLVSADVFVVPGIVVYDRQPYLQFQAYHGPTASLLAELKLPLAPTAPTRFNPSLPKALAAWWPSVLERLERVQHKPVLSFMDVYAENGDIKTAEKISEQLRRCLTTCPDIFFAQYHILEEAQRETLMATLGVGKSRMGRFTPAADAILEGELVSSDQVELRMMSGRSGQPIATKRFARNGSLPTEEIVSWVLSNMQPASATSAPTTTSAADDWAVLQSRREMEYLAKLKTQYETLEQAAKTRSVEAGRQEPFPKDAEALAALHNAMARCAARAAQLDPTSEQAVKAFAFSREEEYGYFNYFLFQATVLERFCDTFPQSSEHRNAFERVIQDWLACHDYMESDIKRGSEGLKVPKGLDAQKTSLMYLRRALEKYRKYTARYIDCWDECSEERGSSVYFPCLMQHYQYFLAKYLIITKASEAEVEEAVRDWAVKFDRHPQAGPGSDFLRLQVLAWRLKKPDFLKLLNRMQNEHPDPQSDYWKYSTDAVLEEIYYMFGRGTDGCTFYNWLQGKGPIDPKPYADYDPKTDTHKPECLPWE